MNLKAVYYALSRMFLPTLSVVIIALMWTLSPTKTFDFILSDHFWAGVLRIVLLLAEMFWFYYLYDIFISDEELNKEINELECGILNSYEAYEYIRNRTNNRDVFSVKQVKDKNTFIVKYSHTTT